MKPWMQNMRFWHALVAALGLVAFIGSGKYMHWSLDHLAGMADGPRLMYRTSHIYILWAALLNLGLAIYLRRPIKRRAQVLQLIGSLALMAGPALILASFLTESVQPEFHRPMTRYAIYLAVFGMAMHAVGHWTDGRTELRAA